MYFVITKLQKITIGAEQNSALCYKFSESPILYDFFSISQYMRTVSIKHSIKNVT